ncbi:MAG: type I-C CRISPR-associated protein Cas8c/Csd1 [Clostridiales bacterium]|jgi:CRISPR-associated protein Csd1|nr:type I-C CRISPR-associated protein Cas8c/Csd1 [Clostridiales bacterium]
MILGSLVKYYEILSNSEAGAEKIARLGYCRANVSYALRLSKEGELLGLIPLKEQEQRGKKTVEVPKSMIVPEQVKKASGIKSNFLCENSSYMLGIDSKGKPERTKQCFNACRELHHTILDDVDSVCAKAVLSFFDKWQPEQADSNEILRNELEAIVSGANLVFYVDGIGYAHEDVAVKRAWETYCKNNSSSTVMPCLVTGERQPVARLHPSIKGVKGAKPTGASLVSFNARAYESYGCDKAQGLNALVSEYAAFAYTTALNYLLADDNNKQVLGDTTIVYWANSPKPVYRDIFLYSLNPVTEEKSDKEVVADKETESIIHTAFQKIVQGKPLDDFEGEINPETRFYILGLSPNSTRLSVRFFIENTFGNIMENQAAHYRDLDIEHSPDEFEYLPLWKLMQETVSPHSKDKAASPLLTGSVLRSIFTGQPYPQALFNNVMVRIRAEREVTRGKAAIIKACLLRKYNYQKYKEELKVSLNEQSENRAYILGRLFSVLEKVQLEANPGINTTIKDRYFTSACATPASVFPTLLRLSNHHLSSIKKTNTNYAYADENRITELMDKLDVKNNPFPAHLSLDEQGLFVLGYYHQKKANFTKKNKEEMKNE